jgi:phosphohistidine phosphatase
MSAAKPKGPQGRVRLHLLRHAHAGDAHEWVGDDSLRPLTTKGRAQSERLGRFLCDHGVRPDVIVSSPYVRAAQTAEIVAITLGMTYRKDERLALDFGKRQLWDLLDELGAREPMLVGHDPDFSMLLAYLIDSAGISMRKAALATVDLETKLGDGEGVLRWLVPPDLLTAD